MEKIITKQDFIPVREELKANDKKIILCHGVFDLVHIGHICHLQEARKLGDVLVVSVTAAKYIRKGPGRPYFNDTQRMQFLASMEIIDYVMLSEGYTVEDIVEVVKPDVYVKGQEYRNSENDVTGKIEEEEKLVEQYGGTIYFTEGEIYSSTKLINNEMSVFSKELREFLQQFATKHTKEKIAEYFNIVGKKKILVVGDIIIDEYIFCKVQGVMSKNIGYSAKFIRDEKYLGGSVAIARHISEFSDNVTLLSVMGSEETIWDMFREKCNCQLDIIKADSYRTIVKTRYVEADDRRKTLDKIFAVNNLPEVMKIDKKIMEQFKRHLKEIIKDYDAVFLCDFGHGLIDMEVINIIENHAKKIILNCQTNSSNYGLNLITKYHRADYFTLDEKELRLAFSDYGEEQDKLLKKLAEKLGGSGCLTRGSKGAKYADKEEMGDCPAFVLEVTDTIGAGDAFFAAFGMMALAGAPIDAGTFIGNTAGALAANIIGNKESVKRPDMLKYIHTLLNI